MDVEENWSLDFEMIDEFIGCDYCCELLRVELCEGVYGDGEIGEEKNESEEYNIEDKVFEEIYIV